MVSKNIISQNKLFAFLFIGPTASGKSALAHSLADELKKQGTICEIVNLDAFQIYKELSAGTAKPAPLEEMSYNYHCINLIDINENMDANTFASKVTEVCKEIIARGNIPFCVGGSGLYLRAFLHGLDNFPPRNDEFRSKLRLIAEENGWPWCHKWLSEVDPIRAQELHPNDKTRIERALEIYTLSGKPMSDLRSKTKSLNEQDTLFPCYVVHVEPDNSILKERIKKRVPVLFEQGWLSEVKKLYQVHGENLNSFHAMQAIGYKEVLNYVIETEKNPNILNKKEYYNKLLERISTLTWQYAKRQGTWNTKEKKDFLIHFHSESEFIMLLSDITAMITKYRSTYLNNEALPS